MQPRYWRWRTQKRSIRDTELTFKEAGMVSMVWVQGMDAGMDQGSRNKPDGGKISPELAEVCLEGSMRSGSLINVGANS